MSKLKIWLITAASLMILGLLIFAITMSSIGWNFKRLSTVEYQTTTHTINEEFSNISIDIDTADITFAKSDDESCKVISYEEKNCPHSVFVENGTLKIEFTNSKKFFDFFGINFDSANLTVYLPEKEYAALSIKSSTGNIEIPNSCSFKSADISASTSDVKVSAFIKNNLKITVSTGDIYVENTGIGGSLNLISSTGDKTISNVSVNEDVFSQSSTGDMTFHNVTCKNLKLSGSTSDIFLNNTVASEKLDIRVSTGNISLDGADGSEIYIKASTGDITGTLLSEKVFFANSDTGDVDVPRSTTGGICEITTRTGDIKVSIK